MSSLKLYFDSLSQPSRALRIFLRKTQIPFESKPIALRKGEHREAWFEQLNPFMKVPIIEHNGVPMIESVAIFRYLCREFPVENHWYPKDSLQQAKVDEYLEWQHLNTRLGCAMYFLLAFMHPSLGIEHSEKQVKGVKDRMEVALDQLENVWLKKSPYLCGNEISIADILGACEIEQPRMAGYDPTVGRPKLSEWLKLVKEKLNPIYDEEHIYVEAVIKKYNGVPPVPPPKL